MQIYQGKSVFSGIAIGKIRVYKKNERQVKRVKVENPDAEMARFEEAKAKGIAQLGVLYEKACKEVGEANAAIFEVHQMMMEDDGYNESVENIIKSQGVNAEYAVATTGDNFAQMFSAMDDDYMRERAADVKDISERLISILNGDDTDASLNDEPAIIVADDLAPSETVQMDKDKVLSFVTVHGSLNSHTAILARTMAIPALVGTPLPLDESVDGKLGIVDGSDGTIYVDPDEETLAAMQKRRTEEEEKKKLLLTLKGKENITLDGQKILLYANIGNIKDLAAVMQNDAGGIGLFLVAVYCLAYYRLLGVLTVLSLLLLAGWNDTAYYPSLADMQSSLTIRNSSSSLFTLRTMAWVSLFVPFVAAYIWYAWRAMNRRPITREEIRGDDHQY